jgi:beta-glucosidase
MAVPNNRFLHPLVYGDYPPVMKRNAGSKLPSLTAKESARVRGSFDFVGVNQYGAIYVADDPSQLKQELRDYSADEATKYVTRKKSTFFFNKELAI